jgi:hypothetical protein
MTKLVLAVCYSIRTETRLIEALGGEQHLKPRYIIGRAIRTGSSCTQLIINGHKQILYQHFFEYTSIALRCLYSHLYSTMMITSELNAVVGW